MIPEFPHKAPKGYSYEFEEFNARVIRVILRHHREYSYCEGKTVTTVWGFYSPKKRVYYAPINAKSVGKEVSIDNTTAYTAMPLNRSVLESCFV
jgi:hypothetical protein